MSRTRATFAFVRLNDALCSESQLLPDEVRALSPHANEKRRREFIAGRVAAHRALERLIGSKRSVVRTPDGPQRGFPRVARIHDDDDVYVSITHHDGLAFAAASRAPIGVDLARIETYSREFLDTVFVDNELDAWPNASIAFAAKEAASKLLRVGFALPLLGFRCAPDRIDLFERVEGVDEGVRRVRFRVRVLGDRVVVVVR